MNEELMREAGFGGGFQTFTSLVIDNGSDISGSDATGEFVEVSFDPQTKQRVKVPHGRELEGVILLSRVVLTYRDKTQTKKKVWESEEFNPLITKKRDGAKALIPIYRLDFNGQRQKTEAGKFIVDYGFYEDLSAGKKANIKGMDFTYTVILYVLTFDDITGHQKEIFKLRFKGGSRGNFFKYQQRIWKEFKAKPASIYTKFTSYLEKSYGKYAIGFNPIIGEDDQPKKYYDPAEIENEIGQLLASSAQKRTALVAPNEQNILRIGGEQPMAVPQVSQNITSTAQPVNTPPLLPLEAYEEDENNKIKLEDIPL